MNSDYMNEYINKFERVLSFGYKNSYSTDALARTISYSLYFQKIEKDNGGFPPVISDVALIKSLFPFFKGILDDIPVYRECYWAAEAYLRIQEHFKLTFEAIFLYIPINKMYGYFDLYHEMDFSQIIKLFNELYKKNSVLSLLLERYSYSIKDISVESGISYSTIYSFCKRRRDIKKADVKSIIILADLLNARVETIAEIRL